MQIEDAIREIMQLEQLSSIENIDLSGLLHTKHCGINLEYRSRRVGGLVTIAFGSLDRPTTQVASAEGLAEMGFYLIKLAVKMKEQDEH